MDVEATSKLNNNATTLLSSFSGWVQLRY